MPSLREKYHNEVRGELKEALGLSNPHCIPRLEKVVLNMGLGVADKDASKRANDELAAITGQKPLVIKAKRSVSNFRLREGMSIGIKVTLRGARMYDFMDRLINSALPRIRDFRGVSLDSFDSRGNYSFGIQEQIIFPEIDPDSVKETQGMDVSIVTSAKTDDEARTLLKFLGIQFAKD